MKLPNMSRRRWLQVSGGTLIAGALGSRLSGQAATTAAEPAAAPEPSLIARYPDLKYINLAGNENPHGPSTAVTQAIFQAAPDSCRYPWREESILRDDIAAIEGVQRENIVLGNGCDEILGLSGFAYGQPGAKLVATKPTYLWLMECAEKLGAHVEWVPHREKDMKHDLDAMAAQVDTSTSLVYVCNPDTPSGTRHEPGAIETFIRRITPGTTVFLDEVYLDLDDTFRQQTMVPLVREGLPLIIGRSFSKMHGLAGHRLGYAVTTPEIAERLEHFKMSSPNWIGVAAARASLRDRRFHQLSRRLIREERERFTQLVQELGLKYTPSYGNFVFHEIKMPIRDYEAAMKEEGLIVGRPFPPYEDWCRTSIGNRKEMAACERAMRKIFA
ncbi:MAG: Aminotransferase classes I and II superfamily [Puniceicoccaceae bacterium 5H]|nr:MAG: Aminotransferase classes I and II superfamily [Puniceicoccaceae bacterium 5H]